MTTQRTIQQKLETRFSPMHLEVMNESDMHDVPKGSESHFKITLVSHWFDSQRLIDRHREVYRTLGDLTGLGVHAVALHTMTPEEWFNRGGTSPESPECLGGSKVKVGNQTSAE